MSYHTNVSIEYYSPDGSVSADMLLAEARSYLGSFAEYALEDILSNLAEGLASRNTSFNDLRCPDLTGLCRALSRKFPTVRLDVWGHGEEFGDVWAVRCLDGDVAVSHGPFTAENTTDSRPEVRFRPRGEPAQAATWDNCRSHVEGEGVFINLIVPDSGPPGREVLLWALKGGPFEIGAFSEDDPIPLPESAAQAFAEQRDIQPVCVAIPAGRVTANCRFFGGDIDLDIHPEQVTDAAAFESMLAIMRFVAAALRLPVFAVSYDRYDEPFLRVSPDGAARTCGNSEADSDWPTKNAGRAEPGRR